MKKFLVLFICYFLYAARGEENLCQKAGMDEKKFFDASLGQLIRITQLRISPEEQGKRIKKLLSECVNIDKVSKFAIGRAKWEELTDNQRKNFQEEYPKYFVDAFKDVIVASLTGSSGFVFKKSSKQDVFIVTFKFSKSKKPLVVEIYVQEKNGKLKIYDGNFADISFMQTQRDMFNRLYDENPNVIKEFKAEKFLKRK